MRFFLFITLISLGLALNGCDSMPARVRERFEPAQPKNKVFNADARAVFAAAQAALKAIDFQVTRAGFAQGIVAGISRIESGESFGKGRQFALDVRIRSIEPAQTEVAVVLREQEESASFSGATDIPLREHALYEAYFSALDRALHEKSAAPDSNASGSR